MFDHLYTTSWDQNEFGKHWCGPSRLQHGEDTLVAVYEKNPSDGDGQRVEVYACSMPATFYQLKVFPCSNSIDEPQMPILIGFGTGMADTVASIAKSIAEGMIGFYPFEKAPTQEA